MGGSVIESIERIIDGVIDGILTAGKPSDVNDWKSLTHL
jgi:hypothetical protein